MPARTVLHLITELALGGAQRSTLQCLARLDRRRFQPTLASSDGRLAQAARGIPGLDVILLPSLRRAIHPLRDVSALRQLTALIRHRRFGLVHTHSSKAGILGRWAAHRAKTPAIVHTIHGFAFHAFQPAPVRGLYQHLERRAARVTDALIAVSDRDRRTGLAVGIGTPRQYRLIRYGIDTGAFHPNGHAATARARLGLRADGPVIGSVACLKPQKAPLDFVQACAAVRGRVPGAQFLLVGDGELRRPVERLRDRLGLDGSLHLLGWRDDVPRVLAALDVFVLASRWEGLPIACLEAMAAGLPIVATTAGGIPELITHGRNGVLVPVAHPERLAEGIVALCRGNGLARAMGDANRQALNGRFTVEAMVQQTEQLYTELLEGARR